MVHRYRVSFFKRLADSTGHAVDACQATVEVSASSKQQAIDVARRQFAANCCVDTWWLRADYETAVLAGTAAELVGKKPLHRPTTAIR